MPKTIQADCGPYTMSLRGTIYGPGIVYVGTEEEKDILETKRAKLDIKHAPKVVQLPKLEVVEKEEQVPTTKTEPDPGTLKGTPEPNPDEDEDEDEDDDKDTAPVITDQVSAEEGASGAKSGVDGASAVGTGDVPVQPAKASGPSEKAKK